MTTPALQLATLYERDASGRLTTTRELAKRPAPKLVVIRGSTSTAWAIRGDIDDAIGALARDEMPSRDRRELPRHLDRYRSLGSAEWFGPAFELPASLAPSDAVLVDEPRLLAHLGWAPADLAACAPVLGLIEEGEVVSICYCSRRSEVAAEAGVETVAAHRGRGHAARVVSSWAAALRATGRTPLYSTSWINAASLAVARKLGLVAYASTWSIE